VLRRRQLLAVRIVQVFAGLVFGARTAIFGSAPMTAVLTSLLILSLFAVGLLGRLTGERLW
jgi:hypothetical protein